MTVWLEDILPLVFNIERPLSNIWLLSYEQNSFGCFFDKIERMNIFKNSKHCFSNISATKYRSDAVLYLKQTAGHPLSSHIKTIVVAFLQAE